MMTADALRGSRWHRGLANDACFIRCCSTSSSLRYSSSYYYAIERFSEDAVILPDLVHLQEQPSKVGPETALECARRAIWGMLYADDACIVSRSQRELERMMAVFVEVYGACGVTILREQNGDHAHADSACTSNADILQRHGATFSPLTGGCSEGLDAFRFFFKQYDQTPAFTYLGGVVTEAPNLSDEIYRRIRVGWVSFRRELYDRPKASLLNLKARMVTSEVVQ